MRVPHCAVWRKSIKPWCKRWDDVVRSRRLPPSIWTPPSSRVGRRRRSPPTQGIVVISRCWRCGPNMRLLPVTQRAFQALPETVKEFYFRGDAGCWEKELLQWLRDERRADGPPGPIQFGISVRMTSNLKKHILRLPEDLWKPYRKDADIESDCADVLNYWPEEEARPEGAGPLRYIA